MRHSTSVVASLAVPLALLVVIRGGLAEQSTRPDREFTLEASVLGYRGMGGEIDGIRNPTLFALKGETIRITIVNGELMVHDIALETLNLKSPQILDKAATTSITFKADQSDSYYCTVPGHRLAGMEGRLDVSERPREQSEGVPPQVNGRAINVDF